MVMANLCRTGFSMLRGIELIIVLHQLSSTLSDVTLQMVVKDRCANATYPDLSTEVSQQKAITDFYMTYNLITRLTPILPALLLARLSDRGWRRAPIVAPLCGYLVTTVALLLVVMSVLPLKVMYGAAVVFGLSGGYCAYLAGLMTVASLGSTATDRSKAIMTVELLYGAAGLVGSLASGHLFMLYTPTLVHGAILLIVTTLLNLFCLVHSVVLLQVKEVHNKDAEDSQLLSEDSSDAPVIKAPFKIKLVNIVLLFAAAILYEFAVGGAVEILGAFMLKAPLSWNATLVGYGNAAGYAIFFTSFLGVIVFRRCISDVVMILIGMLSFASGIYFMSFVTATWMFFLARTLTLFALIPLPTLRSLLSQQIPASSYSTTLTSLELALKLTGLAYIPIFTKLYQRTLDWCPGFVFTFSSFFTVLGMIPISIFGCRVPPRQPYKRLRETEAATL